MNFINTSAGKVTTEFYDDGCAKGVKIFLGDNVVAMLDIYEPVKGELEGEARVLVYSKSYAEDEEETPTHCVTINRN